MIDVTGGRLSRRRALGLAAVATAILPGCGAVQATIDVVRGAGSAHGDVAALIEAVEPAVRSVPDDLASGRVESV